MSSEGLIGVREAARRLRVHENTVRNMAADGRLHPVHMPGSGFARFQEGEVDQLALWFTPSGERGVKKS